MDDKLPQLDTMENVQIEEGVIDLTEAGHGVESEEPHMLTAIEARWAAELKAAALDAGVALPENDYDLALFALVAKGDAQKGVRRLARFNANVSKFGLDVSADGSASARYFHEVVPGYVQAAGTDSFGRPVVALTGKAMVPEAMGGDARYAQACTDLVHAVTSDLNLARRGYIVLYDCSNVSRANLSISVPRMELELFQNSFACKPKLFLLVDAPRIVRLFAKAVVATCLSTKMRNRIRFVSSAELKESGLIGQDSLPESFGGTYKLEYAEWQEQALNQRHLSRRKVKL